MPILQVASADALAASRATRFPRGFSSSSFSLPPAQNASDPRGFSPQPATIPPTMQAALCSDPRAYGYAPRPPPMYGSGLGLDGAIQTFCQQDELVIAFDLLDCMCARRTVPSDQTYLSLLRACSRKKAPAYARQLHVHLVQDGLESTAVLGDDLGATLAKCGNLDDACRVVFNLPWRTALSWTAIISGYAERGAGKEALMFYRCMQKDGVQPNPHTFTGLLKACTSIMDLGEAKRLHGEARMKGLSSHIFVGNTLLSVYAKLGSITEAENVFSELSHWNHVSWNAMLSAYVELGQGKKALMLYRQMQEENMTANDRTFVSVMQACGTFMEQNEAIVVDGQRLGCEIAQALHADAQKKGFMSNLYVCNSLLTLYAKIRCMLSGENLFSGLSQQDIVTWSVMLSAYAAEGHVDKALQVYKQMQEEGVNVNARALLLGLQACSTLLERDGSIDRRRLHVEVVAYELVEALHADGWRMGFGSDVFVGSALVSMYGRCGNVVQAEMVFDSLLNHDLVTWNAMLSAYVEHGQEGKALQLYRRMQYECVIVDDITLMCALKIGGVLGSVELCREVHFGAIAVEYDLWASTLIDAYGNCASMEDAMAVFHGMQISDIVAWCACIAGYVQEGNCLQSLQMFEELRSVGIKPDETTLLSILAACSHSGLIEKGLKYFESLFDYFSVPLNMHHYACIIDLFGRAGLFTLVEQVLGQTPIEGDLCIWLRALSGCRSHGNLELGKCVFAHAMHLQPQDACPYVLMANLYADVGS